MDPTEAAFEAELSSADLPDWNLVRVYADFLEERCKSNDLERSVTMRWMADNEIWPERSVHNWRDQGIVVRFSWWWTHGPHHSQLRRHIPMYRGAVDNLSSGQIIRYYDNLTTPIIILHKLLVAFRLLTKSVPQKQS